MLKSTHTAFRSCLPTIHEADDRMRLQSLFCATKAIYEGAILSTARSEE